MIRALLVDDERLALKHLEHMLKEWDSIKVIASYTDPVIAIQEANKWRPNVIFLDINMPEMNGLKAAEKLQEVYPKADIVFITAYDNYALEAFEVNALDYMLKPLHRTRMAKTILRLEDRITRTADLVEEDAQISVHSFQSLRFERDYEPITKFRWRTAKAQELFCYLLHYRNRFVSKEALIDLLWPEADPKKASNQLYTSIYQVRQCLKQADIRIEINNTSGGEGYTLHLKDTLYELDLWEKRITALSAVQSDTYELHQELFDQYNGDYFNDYDYVWAESERQRLRTIWLHHAMSLAEFYIGQDMSIQALTIYKKVVFLQPYSDEAHFALMKLYDRLGERAAVDEQFRSLRLLFNEELSVKLPHAVEEWYEAWLQIHH